MMPLLRLTRLLGRHWRWFLLGVLLSLATLLSNIALLALSSWFIASMAVAGAAGASIDYTTPAAAIRALALTRAGGRYAERLVNHSTTFRMLSALRVWFFDAVEPLAPAGLERYRDGDLLSRIRADVDALDDFYVRLLVPSVVALLALGCILPFSSRFDVRLPLIDGAGLLAGGVLIPLGVKALGRRASRERIELEAELRAEVVEQVRGMAELIAFDAAGAKANALLATSRRLGRARRRLASLQGVGEGGIIAASSITVWATAFALVPAVGAGRVAGADFAMLTVFVLATFETIMPLPLVIQRIGEMGAAAARLFEIADAGPAAGSGSRAPRVLPAPWRAHGARGQGGRDAHPAPLRAHGARGQGGRDAHPAPLRAHGARGRRAPQRTGATEPAASESTIAIDASPSISVRELSFRYAPGGPLALDRVSFEVRPGERLALVGPTGSGKSTIVSLLLRFWDYESGSIRIDGLELRTLGDELARSLFAVCPQQLHLFHSSIRANLAIAAPSIPDAKMREALEIVQLASFVESLPDGLDTIVGETGRRLSAGQARRLAIARALLKPAPVLLLDEPTEGIDDETADDLLSGLLRRAPGRTTLIITHRARDLRFVQRSLSLASPARSIRQPREGGLQ